MSSEKRESEVDKSIGEKLFEFLEGNPENYDVAFCVGNGPDQKVVRALKIILKAASPVFDKEFREKWKDLEMKDGKEIPLPDFNAQAFQLFIKLTTQDTWAVGSLKNLKLPPDQLLNLLAICRHFEMKSAVKNVEKFAATFMQSFSKYKDTPDFLKLSQANFEAILGSDDLGMKEIDIFACACRWAESKCKEAKLDPSPENIRQALGGCFFEIRFPIMTNKDFTKSMELKSMLTAEETLEIYKFIGLEENKRKSYDTVQLPFKTNRRVVQSKSTVLPGCSTLCLASNFENVGGPPFPCDGTQKRHSIATKKKVALHGLGFLGPLVEDAYYNVTVEIQGFGINAYSSGRYSKKILAEKGKIFHFIFDQPIKLHAGSIEKWVNDYNIFYALKGPKTCGVQRIHPQNLLLQEEGVEFRLQMHSNQLAEILFKKI